MHAAAIRLLETELAEAGHLAERPDGRRTAATDLAVRAALAADPAGLPSDWSRWSGRRSAVAALQRLALAAGISPGPIDGLWGPLTNTAVAQLLERRRTGRPPHLWRDLEPAQVNPNGWPAQSEAALTATFGRHGEPGGHTPPLTAVGVPWRLRIAWDLRQTTDRIHCHSRAAPSLARVLTRVAALYPPEEIVRLRLDRYGGCYNPRRMRGGSAWSTHAWAVAIDWDPERNWLTWGRSQAGLAHPDYIPWWEAWEAEGWVSLGRARNFDWMHVQAAKLG